MNFFGFSLVAFFIELIFETGRGLQSVAVTGLSVRNLFVYGWVLLFLIQYASGQRPRLSPQLKKSLAIFAVLIGYAIVSLVFPAFVGLPNYNFSLATAGLKNDLIDGLFVVLIALVFIRRPKQAISTINSLLLVSGIAAVLTFLDATVLKGAAFGLMEYSSRTKGALGEPNQTAVVLSLMFPLALAGVISNKNRLLNICIAGAMVMALLATGSRAGMVGYLLGSLLLMYFMRKSLPLQKRLMIMVTAALLLMLGWYLLPEFYQDQILGRLNVIGDKSSTVNDMTAGRTNIWSMVYDTWMLSPIIGVGWYGFKASIGSATHNLYLEYLAGLGLIGLPLFLYAWFTLIRFIQKTIRICPVEYQYILYAFLSGLIALLVTLLTVNLYKPWMVVWVFIAPLLSLVNMIQIDYLLKKRSYGVMEKK